MENRTKYTIHGHEGEWVVKHSWISDLGYVMVAFYNLDKKVTMNVNTQTTLEQALQLPWVQPVNSDETNEPNLDIIY